MSNNLKSIKLRLWVCKSCNLFRVGCNSKYLLTKKKIKMDREFFVKNWDLIKAFKEGKEVEIFSQKDGWVVIDSPSFNPNFQYRVKQEPKYVPFDFSDAEKLIGKPIKSGSYITSILSVCDGGVTIVVYNSSGSFLASQFYIAKLYFTDLFNHYTFLDGSKCGKVSEL